MHLIHNGKYLQDHGLGPYIYFPKIHSGVEAEILESILSYCEKQLGLTSHGTKVTTLIETLPAIFQTEQIAYALGQRLVGQNCGMLCSHLDVFSAISPTKASRSEKFICTMTHL